MKNFLFSKVGNLELANPVMIASGVCGFAEENLSVLNRLGAVVFKTVTLQPTKGNPTPRVTDFSYGMLNSIGLENPGVDGIKSKLGHIKKLKCKKIASFLGNNEQEFVTIVEKLQEYKVFDGYELNLSCPNVAKGEWFYDIYKLKKLLVRIRKIVSKPLIAKLSPETDVVKISSLCKTLGYDGVTLTNTYTGIAVDYKNLTFKLGNIYGGFSGPAIKPLVQRWVYEVAKKVKIDIIGCGGIISGEDAIEYFLLGAKAVQIGSGYFRNPQLPVECVEFIRKYLQEKKVNLQQIVGLLTK